MQQTRLQCEKYLKLSENDAKNITSTDSETETA